VSDETPAPVAARTIRIGQTRKERRRSGRRAAGAREPKPVNWIALVAFVMAAVTFVSASFLAIGLAAPDSVFGALSPLSLAHDRRASNILDHEPHTPANLERARQETWQALNQSPADDAAWLRLAYIDRLKHGRLTGEGTTWLERSYEVAPFGPETSLWRVRFAWENWDALTPELRKQVADEVRVQWPTRKGDYAALSAAVANPAGRLAAALMVSQLRRSDALSAGK
jgi:hypothetical protein